MAWSVHDLAHITHLLIQELTEAIKASPRYVQKTFPFDVSGLMPAVSRTDGTNVLSLYLLHVSRDATWRNTPVQGSGAQRSASQPLSLNLSYLLTSYAEKNWHMEQYLMSVALAYFHANPIYRSPATDPTIEFSITVEADSIEEMSRLWQAITVPIRLSAMFRVAVVFLAPPAPPVTDSRPPVEIVLSVGTDLNAPTPALAPHLFELAPQLTYRVPPNATTATQVPGPPVVPAGTTLRVRGSGLDLSAQPGAVIALSDGASQWPITAWRVTGDSASGTASTADELVLRLPALYAAVPAAGTALTATPLPGNYTLSVGASNTLPIAIAPAFTGIGPGQPILTPDATGVYAFPCTGLVVGSTAIFLDTIALSLAAAVALGAAAIDFTTGTVAFMLPAAGLVSGTYAQVRLVVNAVEALPGWWVLIP